MPVWRVPRGGNAVAWSLRAWLRTCLVLGLLLAGPAARWTQAQGQVAQPAADSVTDADGIQAHRLVSQWLLADWVDTVAVPEMRRRGVVGVAVTLRRRGVIVGMGEAGRLDVVDGVVPNEPVNVSVLLGQASEQAFAKVRAKLKLLPPDAKDTPGTKLSELAAQFLVDVQIGHNLQPVLLAESDPLLAVLGRYESGFHGLRVSDPQGLTPNFTWPALTLQANASGESELRRLAISAGLDSNDWFKLGRPFGQALQRFDVLHVVQPSDTLLPTVLQRGSVVLPVRAVRRPTLLGMADALAQHMLDHISPSGLVDGTYLPSQGRLAEELANDPTSALVVYALARHVAEWPQQTPDGPVMATMHGMEAHHRQWLEAAAERLVKQVDETEGAWPLTVAMLLLTVTDADMPVAGLEAADLRQRLLTCLDPGMGFVMGPESAQRMPTALQAVVLAALASEWVDSKDPETGRVLVEHLPKTWDIALSQRPENQGHDLVDPFVWAWMAKAMRLAGPGLVEAGVWPVESQEQLLDQFALQMHETTAVQIQELAPGQPRDVYGGFWLEPASEASGMQLPMPDWRSTQVLWAMANSIQAGVDRRPGADALGWRFTAELGARFAGQLLMNEWSTYYCRQPSQAIGGLRQSMVDNKLTPLANAMGLLALNELLATKAGQ